MIRYVGFRLSLISAKIVLQCVRFFREIPENLLISADLSSINISAKCASLAQLDRASAF